jgi:membrane-associated phospholipid phosphatase
MNLARCIIIWAAILLGIASVVMASFLWLDRPVASFVHDHLRYPHHGVVDEASHFPNPLVPSAVILAVILGLRMILGRSLSHNQASTFVCSLSIIFTEAIKNALKFIFGRTWPETWVQNNPSFIRDGVYGFHFMHGGTAYQSFPSGHMAATCTVISVLWIRYPRFRWFYLIVGLLIGAGLVGANYHFLSDVIAGAFVGLSSGWLVTVIWNACEAQGIVPPIDKTGLQKILP